MVICALPLKPSLLCLQCRFPRLSLNTDGLDFTFSKTFRPVCRSWFSPVVVENYAVRLTDAHLNCTALFYVGEGDQPYEQVPIALPYNVSVSLPSDYFTVECNDAIQNGLSSTRKAFYPQLSYASIHRNTRVRERVSKATVGTDDFNVLVLGIDSVSRLQFERMLPQTFRYITKEMDGIVLNGRLIDRQTTRRVSRKGIADRHAFLYAYRLQHSW